MKLTVNRESFAKSFLTVAAIAPSRSTNSVNRNVLLDASSESGVKLTATDLDLSVQIQRSSSSLCLDVKEHGKVLLPAQQVSVMLREMTAETVDIAVIKTSVVISGGSAKFTIPIEDPETFPAFSADKHKVWDFITVPAAALKTAIKRTVFCCSEEGRYSLGGVLFQLEDIEKELGDNVRGTLNVFGTDGRRMAWYQTKVDLTISFSSAIIPARSLTVLERQLPNSGDLNSPIRVSTENNSATFCLEEEDGDTYIQCRQLEGRFPDCRKAIPEKPSTTLSLLAGTLHSLIRQAAITSGAETRGVRFSLSKGKLTLSVATAEIGNSQVDAIVDYDGNDLSFTVDHRFVGEMLRSLSPSSTVQIQLSDPDSPIVFADDGYKYVCAPINSVREPTPK